MTSFLYQFCLYIYLYFICDIHFTYSYLYGYHHWCTPCARLSSIYREKKERQVHFKIFFSLSLTFSPNKKRHLATNVDLYVVLKNTQDWLKDLNCYHLLTIYLKYTYMYMYSRQGLSLRSWTLLSYVRCRKCTCGVFLRIYITRKN